MNRQLRWLMASLTSITFLSATNLATAQHAVEVVSYNQGTTPAPVYNPDPNAPPEFFNTPSTALGEPERFTGEGGSYPGAVTPFSPASLTSEIVSVGESGHLTLRLSNFVIPQAAGPEIGVFSNVSLQDAAWPSGQAYDPAITFGEDSAEVDVSADGISWIALGNILFDIPANGYSDVAQTVLSDFQKPFAEPLSGFDGLSFDDPNSADILELLDGSGGGEWLDISSTGLSQVCYIRFRVEDDGNPGLGLNFELDAVTIASDAVGAATVPEPSVTLLLATAGLLTNIARRRRQMLCT